MQFLFYGKPKAAILADPPSDLMDKVREDQVRARELYAQGVFRQLWISEFSAFVLCEAESKAALEEILAGLPMAQANMIDIQIFELSPYTGFSQAAFAMQTPVS